MRTTDVKRHQAIALIAASERAFAVMLEERAKWTAPELVEPVAWVAQHLAEIERFFLASAEDAPPELEAAWLDTAERWLTFYLSELRRLEDRAGMPSFFDQAV